MGTDPLPGWAPRTKTIAAPPDDNLLDDISTTYSRNGSGNGILHRFLGTTIFAPPRDVLVFHNTGLTTGIGFLSLTATNVMFANFSFTNNLEMGGMYGISGCSSLFGTAVLNTCAPGYTFAGNVIIGGKSNITAGAIEPSSVSTVGFANFNNGNGGDYRLCQGAGNPDECGHRRPRHRRRPHHPQQSDLGRELEARIRGAAAGSTQAAVFFLPRRMRKPGSNRRRPTNEFHPASSASRGHAYLDF